VNILETLQMVNLSQGNNHPKPLPAKLPLQGFNLWVIGRFNNCNYGFPGATRFGFFIRIHNIIDFLGGTKNG
jgi:hypothetical protein